MNSSPIRAATPENRVQHRAQSAFNSSPRLLELLASVPTAYDTVKAHNEHPVPVKIEEDSESDHDDVPGSEIVVKASSDAAAWSSHLQDIHDYVDDEDLTDTLYCLPELSAYTFADCMDQRHTYGNNKMLFLGESKSVQAWARVRKAGTKLDEVEYIAISCRTGSQQIVADIKVLPISLYPFNIAHGKSTDVEKGVSILVRYVFREAGHVDEEFSSAALKSFRVVLNVIQKAVDNVGGDADLLLNSYMPSKPPVEIVHDKAARNLSVKTRHLDTAVKPAPPVIRAHAATPLPTPGRSTSRKLPSMRPTPSDITSRNKSVDPNKDNDTIYSELLILEAKLTKYENERNQILLRQDHKKFWKENERRLEEIKGLQAAIHDEIRQLLEGKSALWLMEQQRRFKEENEG
ncbi:hypothetical protein N0V83_008147 [Neocucurbitaria cava]|uniref:Uncharacterized protein n=1 Tax=Neocucurbitaria cava TaxID=798079 RepID=A0A9W9CJF6_9PLEO|nr:hypothetical protein N0V83_008147 [Neocucurbitaria cava]